MSGVTSDRKSDGVYLKAMSRGHAPYRRRSNISQVAAQAQHSAHLADEGLRGTSVADQGTGRGRVGDGGGEQW